MFPLTSKKKPTLLKPASCLALAGFGAVALMPLAHSQECKKAPQPRGKLVDAKVEEKADEAETIKAYIWQADAHKYWKDGMIEIAVGSPMHKKLLEAEAAPEPGQRQVEVTLPPIACGPAPVPVQPQSLEVIEPIDKGDVKPPSPEEIPKELICARAPQPTSINPAFTTDLYAQLRSAEGNVFFSPYSISEAMGMVYAGAKGDTATQLASALHFGKDAASFPGQMQLLRQQVNTGVNQQGDQLSIANALCVTGEVPLQSYQDLVRQKFDGELFSGGLEEINGWVNKKTEGKIDKILDQLNPNSACVILNAVYFKGNWKTGFKPSHTHDSDFHLANGKTVKTKMMSQRGDFAMVSNEQWIAVELPYRGNSSMVLLMPTKADQFEAFDASINEALLAEVDKQLNPKAGAEKEIELMMPKFKIATSYSLSDTMKALGVQDAFDMKKADFSAMYQGDDIEVGEILHKATLEVDEKGSVAAAVTAAKMDNKSASRPSKSIRFDRPFIVRIKETKTNTTLFMGRISDPTK